MEIKGQPINYTLVLILVSLLFVSSLFFYFSDLDATDWKNFKASFSKSDGQFILTNSRSGLPIEDYMIFISETADENPFTSGKTNELGEAKIHGLVKGSKYIIKVAPENTDMALLKEEPGIMYEHHATRDVFYFQTFIPLEESYIDVPNVLQNPELPHGCEITSLTAILNYYGADVSKTTMADDYLKKVPFTMRNGKRIGADPHRAFPGNPRDLSDGWYVFAEPIKEAAEKFISTNDLALSAENISGSSREELLDYIEKGIPIVTWVTLDLSKPRTRGGWYIEGFNDFYPSLINSHAVVLMGWKDGKVRAMNPHHGSVTYDEKTFFDNYEAMGSQAVIIQE